MKKAFWVLIALIAFGFAYLNFAPVPIDPISWKAPENKGYVGAFAPNSDLANLDRISLGKSAGPEDVVVLDGALYATSQTGDITRIDPETKAISIVANTGGVPLGIEAYEGVIYIADAHKGLLSMTPDGVLKTLSDTVEASSIEYADDLDIADDGVIYFSDASTKFGAKSYQTTMAASLMEIMESKGTGRVLAYDPRTRQTTVIADRLVFPNGIAIHPDGSVLVTETGRYRVLKIDPQSGRKTDWITNLPGFPDNINRGPNGTYLLGLISPRSVWLDEKASKPSAREFAMRLPPSLRPKAEHYGHIVQIDATGNVLRTFQDPKGGYHDVTGAIVYDGMLYATSLHEADLARRPYPEIK